MVAHRRAGLQFSHEERHATFALDGMSSLPEALHKDKHVIQNEMKKAISRGFLAEESNAMCLVLPDGVYGGLRGTSSRNASCIRRADIAPSRHQRADASGQRLATRSATRASRPPKGAHFPKGFPARSLREPSHPPKGACLPKGTQPAP